MTLNIKATTVGDPGVGKTNIIIAMTINRHTADEEYMPRIFDVSSLSIMHKNMPLALSLWDTAGEDDYDRLRPLSYPQTDVFLVCFDVRQPASLQNILTKWSPEIRYHAPSVPIVLVGTKVDGTAFEHVSNLQMKDGDRTWDRAAKWSHVRGQIKRRHHLWRIKKFWPLFHPRPSPRVPLKDGSCIFNGLCDELVMHIFSYLDTPDLGRVAQVNRRFSDLVTDKLLWLDRFRPLSAPTSRTASPDSPATQLTIPEICWVAQNIGAREVVFTSAYQYHNCAELKQAAVKAATASLLLPVPSAHHRSGRLGFLL